MLFLSDLMKRLNQWWRKSMVFFFALWLVPCIIASALTLTAATRRDSATTRDRACRAAAFTVSTATARRFLGGPTQRRGHTPRHAATATAAVAVLCRLLVNVGRGGGYGHCCGNHAAIRHARARWRRSPLLPILGPAPLAAAEVGELHRPHVQRVWHQLRRHSCARHPQCSRTDRSWCTEGCTEGCTKGRTEGGSVSLEVVGPSLHQDLETLYN